jgi:hypothetical protein
MTKPAPASPQPITDNCHGKLGIVRRLVASGHAAYVDPLMRIRHTRVRHRIVVNVVALLTCHTEPGGI